jgi:hypothetical protein
LGVGRRDESEEAGEWEQKRDKFHDGPWGERDAGTQSNKLVKI